MDFDRKFKQYGDSVVIAIPPDVLKYLEAKPDSDCVIRVEEGKHGRYISIWLKNQNPAPPVPGDADYISESPPKNETTTQN